MEVILGPASDVYKLPHLHAAALREMKSKK